MIGPLLAAVRPWQWVKNLFVLAAPLFGRKLLEVESAQRALGAVGTFCLVSGGVYLLNDLIDVEKDREHPRKKDRPIASGRLSPKVALVASILLLVAGVTAGYLLASMLGHLLVLYVLIQIGYSTVLRRVVLIDVFCIASGFVIRVLGGAAVLDLFLSSWLILTTIFLSLFLAFCKRRAEVVLLEGRGGKHRATLREYEPAFLDQLISVTTASVVLCYSLYTLDARTVLEFHTRDLVYTVPFVIFGIFRYLFLVHRKDGGGSPVRSLMGDAPMLVNAVLWAATTFWVVYR